MFGLLALAALGTASGCGDDSTGSGGTDSGSSADDATSTGTGSGTSTSTDGGGDGGGEPSGSGGGGPTAFGERGFGSGARLRARVIDGGGGAVIFDRFIDTELDTECYLVAGVDGVIRCYPHVSSVAFADAACTIPVFVASECDAAAYGYHATFSDDGCRADEEQYFTVGEPRAGVAEIFHSSDGACVSGGAPSGEVHDVEELDLATLVKAEMVREPLTDTLGRDLLAAEDGAYLAIGAVDLAAGERCGSPLPDVARCAPYALAYTGDAYPAFSDDGCETTVATKPRYCGDEEVPKLVEEFIRGDCGYDIFFYEVGDEVDRGYVLEGEACVEGRDEDSYYRIGEAADLSGFPELEELSFGEGELRVRSEGAAGKETNDYAGFESCVATPFDTLRCVPRYLEYNGYFGDADCEEPIAEAGAAGCDAPTVAVQRADDDGTCGAYRISEARNVGAPHDGAVYQINFDGTCIEVGKVGSLYRDLGPPLDPGTFPEVTLRVE